MINFQRHKRIVVTGTGIVGPLDCGHDEVWRRLLAGHSGIATLATEITEGFVPPTLDLSVDSSLTYAR